MKKNTMKPTGGGQETAPKGLDDPRVMEMHYRLFDAIRRGDESAFSEYYMGFADSLVLFLKRVVGNEEDAREITQDVFAGLWENRARIEPGRQLDGFIYRTAKNMAFNVLRRRKTHSKYHTEQLFTSDEAGVPLDEIVISKETEILVNHAMANMPAQRRKVFELSRFEGMTYEEIAAEMNVSTETVKTHMKLALRDIRDALTTLLLFFPIH